LYYALKILHRSTVYKRKQLQHLFNERQILSNVKNPGIPKLFATFSTDTCVFLLMEFIPGGELFTYIRKYGRFNSMTAKFYTAQIILILEYLHEQNIAIRDIKPESIVIDENGHAKVTEFGFAKHVTDNTVIYRYWIGRGQCVVLQTILLLRY